MIPVELFAKQDYSFSNFRTTDSGIGEFTLNSMNEMGNNEGSE